MPKTKEELNTMFMSILHLKLCAEEARAKGAIGLAEDIERNVGDMRSLYFKEVEVVDDDSTKMVGG